MTTSRELPCCAVELSALTFSLMVNFIELCTFIPVSVTLIRFEGHSGSRRTKLKPVSVTCSDPVEFKLCMIAKYIIDA